MMIIILPILWILLVLVTHVPKDENRYDPKDYNPYD